ncbi:MAG: hypothetical protein AMXMBFR47_43790 [Planctomycetota bacterium]
MFNWMAPMYSVMMAGSAVMLGGCSGMLMGCTPADLTEQTGDTPTGLTADVAAKAEQVAREIGGTAGFGGPMMDGYFDHMDDHMGFHDAADLADENGTVSVTFTNDANQACTFHFAFLRSADGLGAQTRDVDVPAGQSITVEMPCAEIAGMGSLTEVGATAASTADGGEFPNRYCVPGFLNSDYACGGEFACLLTPDVNDVDQDGDTAELITLTSGMQQHFSAGGMRRHSGEEDGSFGGMIGGMGTVAQSRQDGRARP